MQPLPPDWVDSLFARLQVRYGMAWTRMWEGIDMAAVKADWAEELAGLATAPDAIKHALANLPDRPPTVSQFLALCIRNPEPGLPKLPAPKADPSVVAACIGAVMCPANSDPKAWAWRLRTRELECQELTIFQRKAWRVVIKTELETGSA